MFGWGTSGYNHGATCYQPWSTSTSYSDYYAYGNSSYNLFDQTGQADWGYNAISNGGNTENTGWRTLTKDEWDYVFYTRVTSSGIRYVHANVNNVNGVILLPDDWQTSYYSLSGANSNNASYNNNILTSSQWATLEQYGAVFLPAAGTRYGTSVSSVGSDGYYWSASYSGSYYAHLVYFYDGYLSASSRQTLYDGHSVRLVRPAENYSFGINVTPSPAEGGEMRGAGVYMAGAECTLTAMASAGYAFVNWTENGEVVSTDAAYTFTVTRNRNLVANFKSLHWVPNNEFYEDYMMLTGVVNIDSVEQTSTTLELGAFCNDECRGSVLANYCPPLDRYVYQLPVYGNNGDVITFKLFDHNSQQELTMERPSGVVIGDENSSTTSSYFPFYTLYNYSIAEQLYLADELIEAGMNTTPIASLSFEATNETGKEQKNISIWMANVSDAQLTTTSHNTAGMTLVYFGNITPVVGWNEIVFNQNQFAWDGSSNLLICVERSNGNWNTSINWKSHTAGFNAMAYHYRDSSPYNMAGETYTAYTSASRVNTRFRNTSLACQTELVLNLNNVIPADDPMVIYFVSRIPVLTTPSPAEGGEVTGTGEYLPGETVTVTATPYENYVFTGWMENGTLVSTDLEYTFTVESVRNLIARFERVQTITLNSGWNWFSTYIEQNNINGLALLENSLEDHGLQIKSMNDGFVQYDNETNSWSGSLSSITNEQLYMIQTNAETSITLHGDKAKPSQHSISINQGWNWIGYMCDTEMGLEEAMASISPTQNDAVKSRTAFSSYFTDYGWYGNLQTLVPGQGYQYVSQNANTKTLRYPTPSRARNLAKTEAVSTHFDVKGQSYRDNMNFMAVVTLDDLELNGDRYELAAFVDDVCHGTTKLLYVEPLDRYVAFLTVLGQDGEEVSFRLYDDQTGTTYEAEAHEAFHTNVILGSQQSLYPIHFKSKALADNRPAIYPNPANKGASLSIVNASDDMVMEITNMLGVTVKTMRLSGENTTVDCDLVPGAYTVRLVKNHETVMIEKLIVK